MSGINNFTTLCLHCDGANASTTFTDSSFNPHTVTVHNSAQISTAQFKFNDASALFTAATSDFISLGGSSDYAFGTGDFTVDLWVRFNASVGTVFIWVFTNDAGNSKSPYLLTRSAVLAYGVGDIGDTITGTTTLTTGTWYHIALTRTSGTTKLFLNGTQEGSSYSDSNNYVVGSNAPSFAAGTTGAIPADAWMDEIRILTGSNGGWSTTFTPPAFPYSRFACASLGCGC